MPKPVEESGREKNCSLNNILLKEDSMKHSMPPHFHKHLEVEEGISASRHPRSPKAGESQHTSFWT